ncbi:MAG: DUF1007 family protein [Campylobacter sp.]|nr:DUF1007 family protein [Campylobacter sp.]
MRVFKILAIFAIFANIAFSCALCSLYSPTAHISTEFKSEQDRLKSLKFTWTFSENFSNLMLESYDLNHDRILDKSELKQVLKALMDYLVPNHYLLELNSFKKGEDEKALVLKFIKNDIKFSEGRVLFDMEFLLDLPLSNDLVISAQMLDPGNYFAFMFENSKTTKISEHLNILQNSNGNIAFFELGDDKAAKAFNSRVPLGSALQNPNKFDQIDKSDEAKFDAITRASLSYLDKLKNLLKQKEFSVFSLALIAFFSFIYGVAHAAGPGHAKTLTGSYFAANGGDYKRALKFSLNVGFLHVIGSFLIVFATYFTLKNISESTKMASYVTSMFCGALIVAIASFLLYKKLKKAKITQWQTHQHGCSCPSCKASLRGELGVKLAAALVPCPGVIMVFLLAFELKGYLSGAISGVFMGLGMACVVFIAAILGQKVNATMKEFKVIKFGEILALILMITLGIFMIINAKGGVL